MSLSSVDDNAALIVLDLQVATAQAPTTPHDAQHITLQSAKLAKAFRDKGLPIVWVNVGGMSASRTEQSPEVGELPDNWSDLLEDLGVQPGDRTLTKYGWGAFHDDRLDSLLKDVGAGQIFLTGLTTSQAVESTARSAYDRNYHVVVVSDAIGDFDGDSHAHSVARVFPRLGELATTEEVIAAL